MSRIGYGYGSEWHMLRYLGYHREKLTEGVLKETGGSSIHWLDSAFRPGCKPLQDDAEWTGMQAIPEANVASQNGKTAWQNYWPTTGMAQNWDAVAHLHTGGKREWLLIEAKAHIGEMASNCKASSASESTIIKAFNETRQAATDHKLPIIQGHPSPWLKGFYQYANRLAVLHFLNNICVQSIPAQLVYICFYGERQSKFPGSVCPTTAEDWQTHIDKMHNLLEIDPTTPLMQKVHHVFVPINPNC